MSKSTDASIITCSLALSMGACAPSERGEDIFGDGSATDSASSLSDSLSGSGGTSQGPGSSADGSADNGSDPSADGTSAGGSSTGEIKFDIGSNSDLMAGDGGTNGEGCKYLDMLFVVDISGSMSEEHANLAANFPNFVGVLDDYVADPSKGALGYRLGVTNSSHTEDGSTTGLNGALVNNGGFGGGDDCGTGGMYWLDGPSPGIAQNFSCLADNPKACTNSCSDLGKERPLDSIKGFIDKHAPGQTNEGFYRGDESLLVIVTLTDEDDQSTITTAGAKAELDAFTGGEERYVIVTIAGQENSGCTSAFGDATAAPRLHEFTNMVPNGLMGNICDGDLTQALQEALELITFSCDVLPPPEG